MAELTMDDVLADNRLQQVPVGSPQKSARLAGAKSAPRMAEILLP